MKTLILSRHDATAEYIKKKLDLKENEVNIRHNLNPTEIKDLNRL